MEDCCEASSILRRTRNVCAARIHRIALTAISLVGGGPRSTTSLHWSSLMMFLKFKDLSWWRLYDRMRFRPDGWREAESAGVRPRPSRRGRSAWTLTCFAALLASRGSSLCAQAQEAQRPTSQNQTSPMSKAQSNQDRIFGIVPAYTITDARSASPLKSSDKFKLFYRTTLDPFPPAAYAVQAGISQARNTHGGYGQGAAGYGKRFGAALADGTSARFFSTYLFPSLFHQDPRYFRKGEGRGRSRFDYALSRGFVTRADSGGAQPNWSNLLGKLAGGALSNVYYPMEDRGAELTFTRVGISLGYQTLGNLAIEFWPEIRRKIFRSGHNNSGDKKQ